MSDESSLRARLQDAEARILILQGAMRAVLANINPDALHRASAEARRRAIVDVSRTPGLGRERAVALFDELFPDGPVARE